MTEIQTAAVRLVSLVQPNEREVAALAERLRLHPHDREAFLSNQSANQVRPYKTDTMAVLLWPVYDASDKSLTGAEIDVWLGERDLVISHRRDLPPLNQTVESLMRPQNHLWQDPPEMLLAHLLSNLSAWTEQQVRLFSADLATSIGDPEAKQFAAALTSAADLLDQLLAQRRTVTAMTGETEVMFKLVVHRLRYQAMRLMQFQRQPLRHPQPVALLTVAPRLVQSYAVASVIVTLFLLGWLIGR